jgi:hypothetical protein
LYDAAMMPRIVWGPQPTDELPGDLQLRERQVDHRRKMIGRVAALVISVGVLAEVAALATRPVATRSESVPQSIVVPAVAPPVPETVAIAPSVPLVPVTDLPVAAPLPVITKTNPVPVQRHAERGPQAPARAAFITARPAPVHGKPASLPSAEDPFVAAARARVSSPVAPASNPAVAAKPAVDDGF